MEKRSLWKSNIFRQLSRGLLTTFHIMTQIMHGIVVVTLSDTSAWKKIPPDPTPQFPKLADLHCILEISLCNGNIEILRLGICSGLGVLSARFFVWFHEYSYFPTTRKKAGPNMHPLPHRRLKKFKKCWKKLQNRLLPTFSWFSGLGGASWALVLVVIM